MNRRISTALVAAAVISGGCTYMLGKKLKTYAVSQQQQMLRYVSPLHPLEAGKVLQAADLGWTQWPHANPLPGALFQPDVAVGRVVLFPVEQGQPLLERDLAAPGIGGGLGSKIPAGMRAVALKSDEVVGVAGFLAAGSHLDLLVSYKVENTPEPVTTTVVQNAEVLAAGQQAQPDPSGKPSIATVVTLLLNPLDSERAVAASTQGTIHFVLRNALDNQQVENVPVSLSGLSQPQSLHPTQVPGSGMRRDGASRRQYGGGGVETILGQDGGGNDGGGNDGAGNDDGGQNRRPGGAGVGIPPGQSNRSDGGSAAVRSKP